MRHCDKEGCNKQASKRFTHEDLAFCSANCKRQVVNAVILEEKPKRKRKTKKVEEEENVI